MYRRLVLHERTLTAIPCVLAFMLAVSGCGSSRSPTSSLDGTTTAASASSQGQFQATGFTVTIPRGWTDRTNDQQAVEAVSASGSMQMLLVASTTKAAVTNEHIDVTTVAQPIPDDQLGSYLQSVGQNGATAVTTPQPFNLAGATGLFVTYTLTSQATPPMQPPPLRVEDMLVNHGGQTYEIVLNTAQSDFDAHVAALQEVLSSWRWH
jgi:hypothetical protein